MPTISFSPARLRSLPPSPSGKQTDFWDPENYPGLGLRVGYATEKDPVAAKTWFLSYRANGKRRFLKIGRFPTVTLKTAAEVADRWQKEIALGNDPWEEKNQRRQETHQREEDDAKALTFTALVEDYRQNHGRSSDAAVKRDLNRLSRLIDPKDKVLGWFGKMRCRDIARDDVLKARDEMAKTAPRGSAKAIEVVRQVIFWGIDNRTGRVGLSENPASRIKPVKRYVKKARFLTTDEIKRYWAALQPSRDTAMAKVAIGVLKAMLLCSMRKNEVIHMRVQDLDLTDGWWNIPAEFTKTKEPYRVPITPALRGIIDEMLALEISDTWVFPQASGKGPIADTQIKTEFAVACQRAKIDGFTPHNTLDTVESHLASQGYTEEQIRRVRHHASVNRQTAAYIHHGYDEEKTRIMTAWEDWLLQLVGERETDANVASLTERRRA